MKSPLIHNSLALELLDWLAERAVPAEELAALIRALTVIRRYCLPASRLPASHTAKRRRKRAAGVAAIAAEEPTGDRPKSDGRGPSGPTRTDEPPSGPARSDPFPAPEEFKYQLRRTTPEEAAPLIAWIAARLDERGPQTVQQLAAAKSASEKEIKRAIAVAAGRFEWNEDTNTYRLAS
jgi:hypothetical protein